MKHRGDAENLISNEALLSGIAVGDERAVLIFVRRYQRRLFGLALGILGDPGLAEDVAQEAFIRILRHAAVFDARRGSVTSWALTITRNLAIDASRMRRAIPVAPSDWVFTNLVSGDTAPDDALVASDASSQLSVALGHLPIEQRRAVVLASLYGRTAAEIAVEECIPIGTAKGRIRLGMARLRVDVVVKETP